MWSSQHSSVVFSHQQKFIVYIFNGFINASLWRTVLTKLLLLILNLAHNICLLTTLPKCSSCKQITVQKWVENSGIKKKSLFAVAWHAREMEIMTKCWQWKVKLLNSQKQWLVWLYDRSLLEDPRPKKDPQCIDALKNRSLLESHLFNIMYYRLWICT